MGATKEPQGKLGRCYPCSEKSSSPMTVYLELFINFPFLAMILTMENRKKFWLFLRSFPLQPLEAFLKLHVWKVKTIWGSFGYNVWIVQAENCWGEGKEIRQNWYLLQRTSASWKHTFLWENMVGTKHFSQVFFMLTVHNRLWQRSHRMKLPDLWKSEMWATS